MRHSSESPDPTTIVSNPLVESFISALLIVGREAAELEQSRSSQGTASLGPPGAAAGEAGTDNDTNKKRKLGNNP